MSGRLFPEGHRLRMMRVVYLFDIA